jgi:hypothetical protein
VAQLYPKALDSLLVASYDSQGYGGGIRIRFHTGFTGSLVQLVLVIKPRDEPNRKHPFLQLLYCRVTLPPSRISQKTPLPTVLLLLRDVSAVAVTRLLGHCLAACLDFQQICHIILA